jgi:AcrR family transcriptional regulator
MRAFVASQQRLCKRLAMPRGKRAVRRTPEAAHAMILDAAERVFARYMPDEVGLKEIAAESGVSHGLVTHYFGTYTALVEQTLARRADRLRGLMLEKLVGEAFLPGQELVLLRALSEFMRDRVTMRLLAWSVLSGRAKEADFFSARARGLKLVVDGMEGRLRAVNAPDVSRATLEFSVMSALAMAIGFASAGDALHRALGHDDPLDVDQLLERMYAMMRAYLLAPKEKDGAL